MKLYWSILYCALMLMFFSAAVVHSDPVPETYDFTLMRIGETQLSINVDDEFPAEKRAEIISWIRRRADIVTDYYRRFPVSRASIDIDAVGGRGVRGGTTYPGLVPHVDVRVGLDATLDQLNGDWVLVHELIHLASPRLDRNHNWLAEGLSTYVESVARARVRDIDAKKLWGDFVRDMPQGLPKPGDQGLDNTHTWGRTYWGGAIFCLLADVEIHKRSANRFGLQDVLRTVMEQSGGFTTRWTPSHMFEVGDAAISQHVLSELYARMKDDAAPVDLVDLWRQLGVGMRGSTIVFDDHAPLASVRRAIGGDLK